MNIKDITAITLNPVFGAEILTHFLSGCKERSIKFELIFTVLPFVLYKDSRDLLIASNSKSSINSLFQSNLTNVTSIVESERLYQKFKPITQKSLLIACNNYGISVSEYITLDKPKKYQSETNEYLRQFYRASFYLGIIMTKMEHLDVFSKFLIRSI